MPSHALTALAASPTPARQSLVALAALSESLDFVADRVQQAVASASNLAAASGQQPPGDRAARASPRARHQRRAGGGASPGRGRGGGGGGSLVETLAITAERCVAIRPWRRLAQGRRCCH
jgi:hypothetical protein